MGQFKCCCNLRLKGMYFPCIIASVKVLKRCLYHIKTIMRYPSSLNFCYIKLNHIFKFPPLCLLILKLFKALLKLIVLIYIMSEKRFISFRMKGKYSYCKACFCKNFFQKLSLCFSFSTLHETCRL